MKITMDNVEQRLTSVETDTKEILSILRSNPDFNRKGTIETVSDNTDRIHLLELDRKIQKAKIGTYVSFLTVILSIILFTFQTWVKTKIK